MSLRRRRGLSRRIWPIRRRSLRHRTAERDRAEAEVPRTWARMYEQGQADAELIQPDEQDHFAGTSAAPDDHQEDRARTTVRPANPRLGLEPSPSPPTRTDEPRQRTML